MKTSYSQKSIKLFIAVFLLCIINRSFANNDGIYSKNDTIPAGFDIKEASFLLPQALPKYRYSSAIYLLNVVIPPDWTHDIIKAPMFMYAAKYTLPFGFNLQASMATLFISYRLNFGPFYNFSIDNYHFAAGYQVAFNFGFLNEFGFNTTLNGWEQQPSLTVGYSFKKMALTLRGDLYYTNSFNVTEGHNTVKYKNGYFNGYSITTSLEQRLWKNHVMSFGFKFNYVKYHVIAWPAFPVNNYRYAVPEFSMGLNF